MGRNLQKTHACCTSLTEQTAKQLESISVGSCIADDMDNSSKNYSDDITLYRMEGWVIPSAKRFRENYNEVAQRKSE